MYVCSVKIKWLNCLKLHLMSSTKYQPESYFFVEHSVLKDAATVAQNDAEADAFGPVANNLETKYRTTSFVRANTANPVKVFAICTGRILIQPVTNAPDKVNLILRPEANANYAPLKIKYFIYRGIKKDDLISNNNIVPLNVQSTTQPELLKNLWDAFKNFNVPAPNALFPADLIGYNPLTSSEVLIDEVFNKQTDEVSFQQGTYQLPYVHAGMHLGYFTDRIGLDIVLDDGDYRLEHQEELFKFNLEYARKNEHVFDTTTITNPTAAKIARYREYILRFLDAAAFWGSHIDCGVIKSGNNTNLQGINDIYTNVLKKYQTKHTVYIHIVEKWGRSYSYYDTSKREVYFDLIENYSSGYHNETDGWPILIKEYASQEIDTTIYGSLEYEINSAIPEKERFIAIDVFAPTNLNSQKFLKKIKPNIDVNGKGIYSFSTCAFAQEGNVCASFIFINCNLKQPSLNINYFNNLWSANIKRIFTNNNLSTCIYDRSFIVNLDDALPTGAVIQNKVVFDTGKKVENSNTTTKKRRLFIAAIKENTTQNTTYNSLNTNSFISCFLNSITYSEYMRYLYGNDDFYLQKGSIIEFALINGAPSNIPIEINTLNLYNGKSPLKSKAFFQLGIIDDEYNALIGSLPPNVDIDNLFFYLEVYPCFTNSFNVRKYRLKLQYEDNTGKIFTPNPTDPLAPVNPNDVFVYTLDGFYFFSKDFADYQHSDLADTYPKSNAIFRPEQGCADNFGFDWMRDGESNAPAGKIGYRHIMGKQHDASGNVITEVNEWNGYEFRQDPAMYKRLETEYESFFIQNGAQVEKYYVPTLRIYPPHDDSLLPEKDLDRQPIFGAYGVDYDDHPNRVAHLILKLSITDEPERIELKYEREFFDVDIRDSSDIKIEPEAMPKGEGEHPLNFTIWCKKEFNIEQKIEVRAYSDNTDKTGKRIGLLRVKPNNKYQRKSKKIALISVWTDINGEKRPVLKEKALSLKKFLRQAFITPVFEDFELDMTRSENDAFNPIKPSNSTFLFNINNPSNPPQRDVIIRNKTVNGENLHDFLYRTLKLAYPAITNTYDKDIKLFIFDEEGGRNDDIGVYDRKIGGYSSGNFTVCFSDNSNNAPTVPAHEVLHSLGLPHSFNAEEVKVNNPKLGNNAKYTYQPLMTDNIMDYSTIDKVSLWEWQVEIVRNNSNPEPPNS